MTSPATSGAAPVSRAHARLTAQVFTSPAHPFGRHGQTFSPTTSTLLTGASGAVLVDGQFVRDDVRALGDMIGGTGTTLSTIVVTHAHPDHYLGIGELTRRFPGATAVATPAVAAQIRATHDAGLAQLRGMFGDALVDAPTSLPAALDCNSITLDGEQLHVIEMAQGDIGPSAVVHAPSIRTVVAGDIAYNRTHPMLAYCDPAQARAWINSINSIESLEPDTVVAGHKAPDAADTDLATILGGTRSYIADFLAAVAGGSDTADVVQTMTSRYPTYGNPTTLLYSATSATGRR